MSSCACPICGLKFAASEIEHHVNSCIDASTSNPSAGGVFLPRTIGGKRGSTQALSLTDLDPPDEDFILALKLQQEEEQAAQHSAATCKLCSQPVHIDSIYILDECQHKFCKDCIKTYVGQQVMTSVSITCPVPACGIALSVRDMHDLMPKKPKTETFGSHAILPTTASAHATQRLIAEFKHIMESHPEKNGYSVEPVDDNMYLWELKLFNFNLLQDPIARDLQALSMDYILLRISFPSTYPMNPPFVRVIRPRFAFRTGHVTIGGSICTELLTNKGWSPANTIEAVIMSVRVGFEEGEARLDLRNRRDYTESEAKDAFDRMVQVHGWY